MHFDKTTRNIVGRNSNFAGKKFTHKGLTACRIARCTCRENFGILDMNCKVERKRDKPTKKITVIKLFAAFAANK